MSRRADATAEFWALAASLTFVGLLGIIAVFIADRRIADWYAEVALPWFAAPFWVYVLGWTCVYVALSLAGWLVWREAGWPRAAVPLGLWLAQLAILTGWVYVMFVLHRTGWALIGVAALFAAVAATIFACRRLSPTGAALLLVCFAWVGYTGLLNFEIWRLNP